MLSKYLYTSREGDVIEQLMEEEVRDVMEQGMRDLMEHEMRDIYPHAFTKGNNARPRL